MFHLVCVHPFASYERGQKITDPDEVAKLSEDREHHFVRVAAPPEDPAPETVKQAAAKSKSAE